MSEPLPRLRATLEMFPSPDPEHPGLVIRDPFQYSEAVVIVPPIVAHCLPYFDGEHTLRELQNDLTQATGEIFPPEVIEELIRGLNAQSFLETPEFEAIRDEHHRAFAEAPERLAAHAGGAYPEEREKLAAHLDTFRTAPVEATPARPRLKLVNAFGEELPSSGVPLTVRDPRDTISIIGESRAPEPTLPATTGGTLRAIAAPHVSPDGGVAAYSAAYAPLDRSFADKVFVILGTSHYGAPERFGLTRKPFVTPFGRLEVETSWVDELVREGGPSVALEDYCHATEHSIEFQCVFLQHALGRTGVSRVAPLDKPLGELLDKPSDKPSDEPPLRILPVLCGPLFESLTSGRPPEENESVARFYDALRAIAEREGDRLVFVLGIDLAHIGTRYGDEEPVTAHTDLMETIAFRDRERLDRACAGDARGFFELVAPGQDELRWCGYSPLYTYLRAQPRARGTLRHYDQWNIDEESVVSFAALEFRDPTG